MGLYLSAFLSFAVGMALWACKLDGTAGLSAAPYATLLVPIYAAMAVFTYAIMYTACTFGIEEVTVADDPVLPENERDDEKERDDKEERDSKTEKEIHDKHKNETRAFGFIIDFYDSLL